VPPIIIVHAHDCSSDTVLTDFIFFLISETGQYFTASIQLFAIATAAFIKAYLNAASFPVLFQSVF